MKIGVYALCKNEAKYVRAWLASCVDADVICVTDTGSSDGTVNEIIDHMQAFPQLRLFHARVMPWRFDDAFNIAMSKLPDDVDVAIRLDLDERLQPGWRAVLEAAWAPGITRLRYPYVWNWNTDGTPDRHWYGDRIHARAGYRWSGATHEGLTCRGQQVETFTDRLQIHQFPDRTKPRPNDLPLLVEAVRDTPNDTRLWGYLGRECYFKGLHEQAKQTYQHFLTLSSDVQERTSAYIYLAKADPDLALFWLQRGTKEGPMYREPWLEIVRYHYARSEWRECYDACRKLLDITVRPQSYVCTSDAWGWLPHDLCAIAAFNLGLNAEAVEQGELAIAKSPTDARLKNNLVHYRAALTRWERPDGYVQQI